MTCSLVQNGNANEPEPPIRTHDAQMMFALICGNDNFSEWFYQDIVSRCRI